MTSVLSGISGQFGKALVLGTFLPVTVFVILFDVLVRRYYPADWLEGAALKELDAEQGVFALLFIAVLLTGLLYILNNPLIKLVEGYPWRKSKIGSWRVERRRGNYQQDQTRVDVLGTLDRALETLDGDTMPDRNAVARELGHAKVEVMSSYPLESTSVLPTRLGNTIRSFEAYPRRQYKMETIALWPRLTAKIDSDYASGIADAKMSFDFMFNAAVLSAAFGLLTILGGLLYPEEIDRQEFFRSGPWLWLLQVGLAFALASLCYLLSIGRAAEWGDTVKGAFDLYRLDLLRQLGYQQKPSSREDERDLWEEINREIMVGDLPDYDHVPYEEATGVPEPTRATGKTVGPAGKVRSLRVTKGALLPWPNGSLTIALTVTNTSTRYAVRKIVITDQPPDGFDYAWESAQVPGRALTVVGAGPYEFHVDTVLGVQKDLRLTYRVIPRCCRGEGGPSGG